MNITQIRYFIEVCKSKSYTEASRKLYVSQQAVSKQIKALEHEIGTTLFIRSANGVTPTVKGLQLYDASIAADRAFLRLESLAKNLSDAASSELRIAVDVSGILPQWIYQVFSAYTSENPDKKLKIVPSQGKDLTEMVQKKEADIAFILSADQTEPEPGTLKTEIFSYCVKLCISKDCDLSQRDSVKWSELEKYPLFLPEPSNAFASEVEKFCVKNGVNPQVAFRNSDIDLPLLVAKINQGVSVVPDFQLDEERLHAANACLVDLEPKLTIYYYAITSDKKIKSKEPEAFIKYAEEHKNLISHYN